MGLRPIISRIIDGSLASSAMENNCKNIYFAEKGKNVISLFFCTKLFFLKFFKELLLP